VSVLILEVMLHLQRWSLAGCPLLPR